MSALRYTQIEAASVAARRRLKCQIPRLSCQPMALITCPECSRGISDQAFACVQCGYPLVPTENTEPQTAPVAVVPGWIRGYEWEGVETERLHCLSCETEVEFPRDLGRHRTHRLEQSGPIVMESRPVVAPPVSETSPELLPRWNWKRIASFRSRTRRIELLVAYAASLAIVFVGGFIDSLVFGDLGLAFLLAFCVFIWVTYGASANRLHDVGRSGWWALLLTVPFVYLVVVIWLLAAEGEENPNRWGPPVA